MEIRTLRYFLAVAREENMTRAAESLHVTQPTLSKALRSLEEELGKKLFTRHSFSIQLTEEGTLLRDRAEDLVSMADKIEKEFVSLDDIQGGDLYFGLAESYQIRYLAREIYRLKQRYPALRYHITSGDSEQVLEKLDKGLLDFAVLAEVPDLQRVEAIPFPEDDVWGVVMKQGDPLAEKKELSVKDLFGLPLFASEQSWYGEIKDWAGKDWEKLQLEGSFRLSYNGSVFAGEGLGYLLTFDHLVDTSKESGMCFVPLVPKLTTRLYLVYKKYQTLTPLAERFLQQVRQDFPLS
ncbi:MAG: LysR family transcriptional regulator [Erysipelotrichaceae bacterium]|nr:LysR family transcriptional regulator [Erysipelotrichaceae bacterium]